MIELKLVFLKELDLILRHHKNRFYGNPKAKFLFSEKSNFGKLNKIIYMTTKPYIRKNTKLQLIFLTLTWA